MLFIIQNMLSKGNTSKSWKKKTTETEDDDLGLDKVSEEEAMNSSGSVL